MQKPIVEAKVAKDTIIFNFEGNNYSRNTGSKMNDLNKNIK